MQSAAKHTMLGQETGLKYIMPDGSSWWDSGFAAGAGCEYVVDACWLAFPRETQGDYPLLGEFVYNSGHCMPCTFNYNARRRDALTSQIGTSEIFCYDVSGFLNIRSTLRVKHKVSGNSFSVGFDGGTAASGTTSNSFGSAGNVLICYALGSQYIAYPMPINKVKIYSIKMYRNGVLEKWFVPAKRYGHPCFRDMVSGAYVFSSGATDGVYGVERTGGGIS